MRWSVVAYKRTGILLLWKYNNRMRGRFGYLSPRRVKSINVDNNQAEDNNYENDCKHDCLLVATLIMSHKHFGLL